MVKRSVAVALGIICILLIAVIAYFSITGISAQNSYNNLQNQNNQLQAWLDGNETLLNQTETWLDNNITYYNSQISSLNSQIANLTNQEHQLQTWLNGNITSYISQITSLNSQITSLQNQFEAYIHSQLLGYPLTKADEFLAYHLYNPEYGLLPEADDIPVYWITCDNMLAWYALKDFNKTISDNILSTIKQYAINYSLPVDANGMPISYKHEVLLRETIPTAANDSYPFWQWVHYNLTVPSWSYQNLTNNPPIVVVADIQNDTHLTTDWMQYEDLVLYKAMDYFYKNRFNDSERLFNVAASMWDGTGINDKAYNDTNNTVPQYQTYKLILLCYTRRLLGLPPLSFEGAMMTKILSAQRDDGGIRTGYAPSGEFNSDANTETTTMFVILAHAP